jgi:cell division protein FtsZ
VVERQEQTTFSLICHTNRTSAKVEETASFELTMRAREIKVNQPVQFVPVTELSDRGIIKYSS